MDSIISTFHIDWKIIIAQAVNFAVVIAVLYFFAIKPLQKLMAERTEKISKGVDDAKLNAHILEKTKAESDKLLAEAKDQANKIFQVGKKEAEAKKVEMLEDARLQMEGIMTQGKKALEAEKIKMVEDAKKELGTLVTMATEKVLSSKQNLDNV